MKKLPEYLWVPAENMPKWYRAKLYHGVRGLWMKKDLFDAICGRLD